jgi:hypothetical protein
MLHFQSGVHNIDKFWLDVPSAFGDKTGTDLYIGRNTYSILKEMGLLDITIDYVIVDTLRVPRPTFASIIEAWRDGYAQSIGELTAVSEQEAHESFNQMIASIQNPTQYAVWMVPVISAKIQI